MKLRKAIFSTLAVGAVAVASAIGGGGIASASESTFSSENVAPEVAHQSAPLQHVTAPDASRFITAQKFQGSVAISTVHTLPGDTLRLSEDQKTIVWLSKSGETVATLDATSSGRTPFNWFELSGNTIKLHFFKDRSACGNSYAGAATFGVSWELGVCLPLGLAFAPAGIACGVGSALVSPLIPFDHAC